MFANSRPQPRIAKVFLNHLNIFSHSRSEQFWKQNTISLYEGNLVLHLYTIGVIICRLKSQKTYSVEIPLCSSGVRPCAYFF